MIGMREDNDMKVEVQNYHKSVNESGFTLAQAAMIWDFYVANAIEKSSSTNNAVSDNKKDDNRISKPRTVGSYGWRQLPLANMLKVAGIAEKNVRVLLADSMLNTLKQLDLIISKKKGVNIAIDIDTPRIACLCLYKIADEGKPTSTEGSNTYAVLRHIRNSLAHGRTYFFDNGNVLLEDKSNGTITARMILKQQTLLDWIGLIDKEQKYYVLHDFCASCGNKKL